MDTIVMELEQRIQMMMNQSQDVYYTEYLKDLQEKMRQGKVSYAYVASELDRTFNLYQQRMQAQQQSLPVNKEKKNTEFVIGAGVLSIVGAVFILIAFVMLGMTYMNGLVKGLCLYVIALVVLLFSELVINRKMPKLAIGITGIAICGFFLSTVINYIYLNNINGIAAMIISVLISLAAVLLSRKKDSGIIKIISFGGFYISLLPLTKSLFDNEISQSMTQAEISIKFLVLVGIILIMNIMTISLPVNKMQNAVHITHMVVNSLFTFIFIEMVTENLNFLYVYLFAVLMFLFQGLIFTKMQKWCAVYIVAEVLILFTIYIECFSINEQWLLHGAMGILLIACIVSFMLLRKNNYKWIPYWLYISMGFIIYGFTPGIGYGESYRFISMGVLIVLFLATKCLSGVKILRSSELVFTCLTAIIALNVFTQSDFIYAVCYLGAFLISLLLIKNWKSLYEEIILILFECFVLLNFRNDLVLAVLTGILFIGVIAFNHLQQFKDNQTKIYNYINLGIMTCLYLGLIFNHNTTTYIIMLLLGIAFVILMFRDKYAMNFKCKNMIIIFYFCYMIFVCNIPVPVIKSILLMIIAIVAVTVGFIIRNKSIRICGLVLSLVVCFKIALFDFAKAPSTEKIILFLVVGTIALAISGIYIALEKKVE